MAIQWFLNHLNETFETDINRKIIQAYRQDPPWFGKRLQQSNTLKTGLP